MADDGPLHDIRDWGSKLPGAMARIAAGIHWSLYPWVDFHEIELEITDVAIALGGLLLSNTVAAFRIMQKPEKIEHEKLLAWIVRNSQSEIHLRDMFRYHQSRFGEMATMMPAIVLLQDHGYIRPKEKEQKPGRPAGIYEVNPELFGE